MCSICNEKFDLSTELHSTDCGHIYHLECIQDSLNREKCCPQCRKGNPLIHRIYLQLKDIKDDDTENYINSLQFELERLHDDTKKHISFLELDIKDLECQIMTLRDDLSAAKSSSAHFSSLNAKLKRQLAKCRGNLRKLKNDKKNAEMNYEREMAKTQSELKTLANRLNEKVNNVKTLWLVRQTSQGDYTLNGPYQTISAGIIDAKKATLRETGVTVKGVDGPTNGTWFNWLQDIYTSFYGSNAIQLKKCDIIKTLYVKQACKFFIQFRTAEWRERFLQITDTDDYDDDNSYDDYDDDNSYDDYDDDNSYDDYNDYSNRFTSSAELDIQFTTEILPQSLAWYDTLDEYAQTLKVAGFKKIYRHSRQIVARRCRNSQPIIIKSKEQVDNLMKAELNL